MQKDGINSDSKSAKAKQYPIKHKRPKGQIIERAPNQFMVWLYLHTDAAGKPVRYTKTFKTLKEADAHLTEKLAEKNRGRIVKDNNETLQHLVERYLRDIAPNRMRKSTLVQKEYTIAHYLYPKLGRRRVKDLTYLDFVTLYNELCETVSEATNQPLARGTINRVFRALRSVFSFYVETNELNTNPMEHLILRDKKTKKVVPLTAEEVHLFLQTVEQIQEQKERHALKRVGPMFHLLFECGLRPSECVALTWEDVSLNTDCPFISIRRTIERIGNRKEWTFEECKTPKSRRRIPLSPYIVQMLKEHQVWQQQQRHRPESKWKPNNFVFSHSEGGPQHISRIAKLFKDVLTLAGLDRRKFWLYGSRHTMATLALTRNIHPKIVSERLGHSTVRHTMDTYSHVVPSLQEEATECLGNLIHRERAQEMPIQEASEDGQDLLF